MMCRKKQYENKRRISPALVLVIGFFAVIFVGTGLLMLPFSARDGSATDVLTAAFTAVSSTCVTGLVCVDTASHYGMFGQAVILVLIQIGGLGFMSMAFLLSMLLRRKIMPRERVIIAQSMGLSENGGTSRFVRRLLVGTFFFEGAGALVLFTRTIPRYGFVQGIWRGVFLSVSAFCNAGFDPLGTTDAPFQSVSSFVHDPVVLITLMVLITIGGIGFIVWNDVWAVLREKRRLGVYSRFVIAVSACLILSGALLFALFEWNNPATIGALPVPQKVLNCFFQSVTLRTAGFSAIDPACFTEEGAFVSILYMLIGGASGSTAGGLKVGTVGVVFAAAVCAARGRNRVVIYGRRVSSETVLRALSCTMIGIGIVMISGLIIAVVEDCGLLCAVYETASAYATVGISMFGTPAFSAIGKIILMALMFMGRVGLLTVTYAIAVHMNDHEVIDYPTVNIPIG